MSTQNIPHGTPDILQKPHFLIIGSGRLARHLKHYFQLLDFKYSDWDRTQDAQVLSCNLDNASHVLLAVSDSAIANVYQKHFDGFDRTVVHFSGALIVPGTIAAHPLMTFGEKLYSLEFYQKIHFSLTGANQLTQALPGLQNSFSILSSEQKPLYHALCVMGGNFTTLLVQKMLAGFNEMNLPSEAANEYMQRILENVFENPQQALTGPLARRDRGTIEKNIAALGRDPYQKIYSAFVQTHWPEYFNSNPGGDSK